MEKTYITKRQFFTIIFAYVLSNEYTRGMYMVAYKQSTWIPLLLAIPLSCFLFFIYSFIYKNNDYPDFKTAMEKILGKFFSKFFFFIYLIYFLFLMYLTFRDVGEVVKIYIMQDSPILVVYAGFLLAALYSANKGIEVLGRYAGISFFITFVSFVFFYVLLIIVNEPDFNNFLPFLPNGFKPLIDPTLKMAYSIPLGELFVMLVIFQYVKPEQKKKAFKTSYIGIITIGITLLIITVSNIIFLEAETLVFGYTPIIRLWRRIDVEDFIQRLDLIVINILILNFIVKATILLNGSKIMFDGIKQINKKKLLYYFIIIVIIFIALFFIGVDYTKLTNFRYKYVIPYVKSTFEVFIPILIVIISFLRRKQIKADQQQLDYNI